MSDHLIKGALFVIPYKTGRYIAEFVERSQSGPRAVMKILSVLDHPQQGDLHHPFQTDVPIFHQRKASAYQEHVLVPIHTMELYEGEVIDYTSSLASATDQLLSKLIKNNDQWSLQAREQLLLLKQEYGF